MIFSRAKKILLPVLLAIVAGTLIFCATRPIKIDGDILSLLPRDDDSAAKHAAYDALTEQTAGIVNVLFEADSRERATGAAERFLARVSEEDFSPAVVSFDFSAFEKSLAALKPFRFSLLSERHRDFLKNGHSETLTDEALANIFSPMSLRAFSLKDDPYGFATSFLLENPMFKTAFSPCGNVLASEISGRHFAYIPLALAGTSVGSLSELQRKMEKLVALQRDFSASEPGVRITLSGVPAHTFAASSSSMREVNVLTAVSFALLLALFLGIFRSPKTFFAGISALVLGAGAAFLATNAVFGNVHTMVLVFGVSLMGIAVDYVVHFQISRDPGGTHLRRALAMSAFTTTLGFSVFFFSGVPILAQTALFSIVGIAGVFAVVSLAFPRFFRAKIFVSPCAFSLSGKISSALQRARKLVPAGMCVLALGSVGAIFFADFTEDIRTFYTPKKELVEAEKTFAIASGNAKAPEFILAIAPTADAALERAWEISHTPGFRGQSISALVPPAKIQRENRALANALLDSPGEDFPIRVPASERGNAEDFLTAETLLADPNFSMLKMFFGQASDGNFYAVLRPDADADTAGVLAKNPDALLMNKAAEISASFHHYKIRVSILLAVALAAVAGLFAKRYGARTGLAMLLPSLFAMAGTFCALVAAGFAITFFHVLAFFLILGFGVDYVIHRVENGGREAGLSILISCATTLASFGLLAFTQFPVTRGIGLCVFVGITLSYVFSAFVRKRN